MEILFYDPNPLNILCLVKRLLRPGVYKERTLYCFKGAWSDCLDIFSYFLRF